MIKNDERDVVKSQSYIRSYLCKKNFQKKLCSKYDGLSSQNELQLRQHFNLIKLLFNKTNFNVHRDIERYCIVVKLILEVNDIKVEEKDIKSLIILRPSALLQLFERFLEIGKLYLINSEFEAKFQTLIALYLNFIIYILNLPSHADPNDNRYIILNNISSKLLTYLFSLDIFKVLHNVLYNKLVLRKCISKVVENASIFVILKLLQCKNYSKDILGTFFNTMFIIPEFVHYMSQNPYYIAHKSLFEKELFSFILNDLNSYMYNAYDGNQLLIVISNLSYYFYINQQYIEENLKKICIIFNNFILNMKRFILVDQKQAVYWHSVFGWTSIPSPCNETILKINKDIKKLWSPDFISKLVRVPAQIEYKVAVKAQNNDNPFKYKSSFNKVKHLPNKFLNKKNQNFENSITNLLTQDIYINLIYSTTMYEHLMDTLVQQKLNILSSFSYNYHLIESLWSYLLHSNDLESTINMYVQMLKFRDSPPSSNSLNLSHYINSDMLNPIIFACDITSHVIIILDDEEIFVEKVLFKQPVDMIVQISKFLNRIIYKIIWELTEIDCDKNSSSNISQHQKMLKIHSFSKFFEKLNFLDINESNEYENIGNLAIFATPFFLSCHTLLKILFERDNKKSFAPQGHWLINEVKLGYFFDGSSYDLNNFLEMEIEHSNGNNHYGNLIVNIGKTINYSLKDTDQNLYNLTKQDILLNKIPHILSQNDRIILFRKYLGQESGDSKSEEIGNYIKIRRTALLEDGFAQINGMSPCDVKGIIRVRFVNSQGLEEPGIDQDGVFKEFLEEIVKKIFDPSLNLFKITSDQKYYPSPTSYVQDNHLGLFEFVGRLVGKAIFEGIVLDGIELAPFFLNQIVNPDRASLGGVGRGNKNGQLLLYSPIDELESMDSHLYKNLKYLKKCNENVEDLALTFAVSTECMGRVETEDLIPGGRSVAVTCDNRFSYIHLMARHRMHVQIHKQLSAFLRGFHAIIPPQPISIFSGREFQQIISGDTREMDLNELRKYTKYYGGFFDKHRVVTWLWDILANDFDAKDRALFLKFVTSCSRPPLQGFSRLEPPFSIRCVDVGEEQDTGDTLGTVIQGFFSLRRIGGKDKKMAARLPTASTCFNLLKLPNYSKKCTLRDKLKYAIYSNTGFELS